MGKPPRTGKCCHSEDEEMPEGCERGGSGRTTTTSGLGLEALDDAFRPADEAPS